MGDARKAGGKAGAFNRKPADRRLVREVTVGQRAPKYWTPMVISEHECKVMEVSTNIRASPTQSQHNKPLQRPNLQQVSKPFFRCVSFPAITST